MDTLTKFLLGAIIAAAAAVFVTFLMASPLIRPALIQQYLDAVATLTALGIVVVLAFFAMITWR